MSSDHLLRALRGTLVSRDFCARELLPRLERDNDTVAVWRSARAVQAWWRAAEARLGPASGLQATFEVGAVPLLRLLGHHLVSVRIDLGAKRATARLTGAAGRGAAALIVPWNADLGAAWRAAVAVGIAADVPWCLCFNGPTLRIVDAQRSWTKRYVELDLGACASAREVAVLVPVLASARALAGGNPANRAGAHPDARMAAAQARPHEPRRGSGTAPLCSSAGRRPVGATPGLEAIVDASNRYTARVCGSLQAGVLSARRAFEIAFERERPASARGGGQAPGDGGPNDALTVVFRLLFLLYAEARSAVPLWHPIYRDSYSVGVLRDAVERGADPRGLWESLQAIARLAHAGCAVDTLRVSAFNGQLFSPDAAPRAESARLDDGLVREALLALTTSAGRGRPAHRIAFADLGVEQLGAVYERLLDEDAVDGHDAGNGSDTGPSRPASVSRRKTTSSFYSPRSITEYLVRRTLHPLASGATPTAVLALRVLDPAMGSGAFLVAACRYLAEAYEAALVRAGDLDPGDATDADRAAFRRLVAQRCLFGVDLNPMAVQLARLSLWLATLAAGLPLTFLDHRLRQGNSLVGAAPEDLVRQPPGTSRRAVPLPLFDGEEVAAVWRHSVAARIELAEQADTSADVVHAKEQRLRALAARGTPLATWRRLADLWCALWFWDAASPAPPPAAYGALCDAIRGRDCSIPPRQRDAWLGAADQTSRRAAFFHWQLEFPEVFAEASGLPRAEGGFDAVLGNPPWDMVRGDSGGPAARAAARANADRLTRFVRGAGLYTGAHEAHGNLYQLFVERALSLLKPGGRLGLVVPWGLLADHGSGAVRARVLRTCRCDALVSLTNRHAIFPIHRSVHFALVTATSGTPTRRLACRLGESDPASLDTLPDAGAPPAAYPVGIDLAWLQRIAGPGLPVPELQTPEDLALVERLFAAAPPLGSEAGWGARFGRELNATDDRARFTRGGGGLPVLEGKHIAPFEVATRDVSLRLPLRAAPRRLAEQRPWERARLAVRDVASSTNRVTIIAAVLPAGTVSTHTLNCLRTPADESAQWFLCALLNSYVLNYLARLWVSTHVTGALLERLPAPRPAGDDPRGEEIAGLAAGLARARAERPLAAPAHRTRRRHEHADPPDHAHARLQAHVAALYGLDIRQFSFVLGHFPLVPERDRQAALEALGADELPGRGGKC